MNWTRALTAGVLICALATAGPARADVPGPPGPTNSKLLPLPAPGTHRLIRIGPQALVSEDDRGQVTFVDEAAIEPKAKRGESIVAASVMLGLLGAGAILFLGPSELTARPGPR